jgi:hypothetical protein
MRNVTAGESAKFKKGWSNPFDLKNCRQNIKEVFGDPMLLWLLPTHPENLPSSGVTFQIYSEPSEFMFNPLFLR